MRTTQTGVPPPRSSNHPTRPLASLRHQASGNSSSSGLERTAQLPRSHTPTYKPLCYLGRGSFGVVLLAEDTETGKKVAIKRVRYDPRLHNREVAILSSLLVEHRSSSKSNVTSSSDANRRSSSSTSLTERSVQEWAGIHHPNIVELIDSYVTYDSDPTEADATAAAAATFHAQMGGVGRDHRGNEFFAQVHPSASAGPANAYLEMVMSYLPMDLYALKKHFYRHHMMPTAESSTQLSSSSSSSIAPLGKPADEVESDDEGRVRQLSTSPRHASSRPASPKVGPRMPLRWVKIFLFQLARALAFMHTRRVCHRDLKPANVLVDPDTGRVQLCDFGSAKQIFFPSREKNVSYICSRYYRAPELLFGALHYNWAVDMWSFGCILAELLRESGRPLFRGCTSVDQMAELFKVMGAPSTQEMYMMNPECAVALMRTHAMHQKHSMAGTGFPAEGDEMMGDEDEGLHGDRTHGSHDGFLDQEDDALEGSHAASASRQAQDSSTSSAMPHHTERHAQHDTAVDGEGPTLFGDYYDVLKVRAIPWKMLFPVGTPNEAVSLVTALLCYIPQKRLPAVDVVEHAFFDDLFAPAPSNATDAHRTGDAGEEVDEASLRMPNGRLMPLEMFQVTATERVLFTDAFLEKMARQAELISAAMKKEAQRNGVSQHAPAAATATGSEVPNGEN